MESIIVIPFWEARFQADTDRVANAIRTIMRCQVGQRSNACSDSKVDVDIFECHNVKHHAFTQVLVVILRNADGSINSINFAAEFSVGAGSKGSVYMAVFSSIPNKVFVTDVLREHKPPILDVLYNDALMHSPGGWDSYPPMDPWRYIAHISTWEGAYAFDRLQDRRPVEKENSR